MTNGIDEMFLLYDIAHDIWEAVKENYSHVEKYIKVN